MLLLALIALVALAAPWTDPAGLTPLPGPDVAPPVKLRDVPVQFLAWTGNGQEMLALDGEGFAIRDLSGARRVARPCPGRKDGTTVVDAAASADRVTQAVLLDDGHVCVWAGGLPPLPLGRKDWSEIELLDASTLAIGRTDGTVEVRELQTGRVRWRRNVGLGAINGLRQSMDGASIFVSGAKRGGAVFYAVNGRLIHTAGREPSFSIVPDVKGNAILLGRGDGRVERWDMRTWRRTASMDLGDGPVVDLDLSSDGDLVLAALDGPAGRAFRAWSLAAGDFVFDQPTEGTGQLLFRFVPGSGAAIANGGGLSTTIWRRPRPAVIPFPGKNVEPPRLRELPEGVSGGELLPYPGDPTGLADAVMNPDGSRVVGRDPRGGWSLGGIGEVPVPLTGAEGLTLPVVWAPDGTRFAAWVAAGELRTWSSAGVLEKRYLMDRPRAFVVDRTRVLVAGADGQVRVSTEKGLRVVRGVEDASAVAFDPARAERFGYGTAGGDVRVTLLSGSDDRRVTSVFSTPVGAIAFAPDGRRIAVSAARVGEGAGASVVVLDEQAGESSVAAGEQTDTVRVAMRVDEPPRRLAFLDARRILVEEPRGVRVIDAANASELLVNPGDVASAAVSGLAVLVADGQGRVRRLPLNNVRLAGVPHGRPLGLSADGRLAAVADGDTVILWQGVTSLRRMDLPPASAPVVRGVFDRTSLHFAALTADGEVEVYETAEGGLVGHTPGPTGADWLRFSPGGEWIWTTDHDDLVAWNTEDGAERVRVDLPAGAGVDPLRSQGRFLTVNLPDGTHLWVDAAADALRRTWPEDKGERPLAVGPAGKVVAVATSEGVERKDLATGLKVGRTLHWPETGPGAAAAFTTDGEFLAVVDPGNIIRMMEVETNKLARSMGADAPPIGSNEVAPVVALAFGDTGSRLVSFDAEGRHRSWQWGNGFDQGYDLDLPGDVHAVGHAMGFLSSRDGAVLYLGFDDGTIRGWDTRTAELSLLLRAHVAPVRALAQSEDGARLASGGEDGVVRVYTLPDGAEVAAFSTLGDPIRGVHLDGPTVWAVTAAGVVRRWDIGTQKRLGRWTGGTLPTHEVPDLGLDTRRFGPAQDGLRLLGRVWVADADDRIRIWDTTSGTLVGVIVPLSDGSFVLDRCDGRRVASPSLRDGTAPPLFGSIWEGVSP